MKKNELWILTVGHHPKLKVFEEKDAITEYYLILDKYAPIEELQKDDLKFQEIFKETKPSFPYKEFAELVKEIAPFVREANFDTWEFYLEAWEESLKV